MSLWGEVAHGLWDLSSLTRNGTHTPAVVAQGLDHWTAGEDPVYKVFKVEVAHLGNSSDCSPPGSSVCGILHARMLEWVAIPFSRGSSRPRDQTRVSCVAGRIFTI